MRIWNHSPALARIPPTSHTPTQLTRFTICTHESVLSSVSHRGNDGVVVCLLLALHALRDERQPRARLTRGTAWRGGKHVRVHQL